MNMEQVIIFYSTCQAPTERDLLRERLGMDKEEFVMYEEFKEGKNSNWLMVNEYCQRPTRVQ